jgi:hypothetical protein
VSHWIRHIPSCRKLNVETPCSSEHYGSAIAALHAISQWPEGVAALADTEIFEELQQLPREKTYDADRTQKLYTILDNITRYKARNPDSSVHEEVDCDREIIHICNTSLHRNH